MAEGLSLLQGLSRDWGDEDVTVMTGEMSPFRSAAKPTPVRDPSAGNNPFSHIAYVLIPPISGQPPPPLTMLSPPPAPPSACNSALPCPSDAVLCAGQ